MARLLVVGSTQHLAGRELLKRIVDQARSDGHDAAVASTATDIAEADGLIAILDEADAATAGSVAGSGVAMAIRRGGVIGMPSSGEQTCGVRDEE